MEWVWVGELDCEIPALPEASFPSRASCEETSLQGEWVACVAEPKDIAPTSSGRAHEPCTNQRYQLLHPRDPQCLRRRADVERGTLAGG